MSEFEMMTPLCPAGGTRHLCALPTVATNLTRVKTPPLLLHVGSHLTDRLCCQLEHQVDRGSITANWQLFWHYTMHVNDNC